MSCAPVQCHTSLSIDAEAVRVNPAAAVLPLVRLLLPSFPPTATGRVDKVEQLTGGMSNRVFRLSVTLAPYHTPLPPGATHDGGRRDYLLRLHGNGGGGGPQPAALLLDPQQEFATFMRVSPEYSAERRTSDHC